MRPIFILLLLLSTICQAQLPLHVALARVCVAEAGWSSVETGECRAIYEVVESRAQARGVPHLQALTEYAALHFDRRRGRRERRRWVVELTSSIARPHHWPRRLAWDSNRWAGILAYCLSVVEGAIAPVCHRPPDHWGGRMDDWRARRQGWRRVNCGHCRNHFWHIP